LRHRLSRLDQSRRRQARWLVSTNRLHKLRVDGGAMGDQRFDLGTEQSLGAKFGEKLINRAWTARVKQLNVAI
jgi:hypothetical protein